MNDCNLVLLDSKRLRALSDTELMQSPIEEPFQRLNRLAAKILKSPYSIFSLMSDRHQFFKSAYGLEPGALLPLDASVCKYAFSGAPINLSDTKNLPLFLDNTVVQDMNIRGYLGVPVTTAKGDILGTLCVFDQEVRHWSEDDVECLKIIASSVLSEIELRSALRLAEKSISQREEFMSVASHEMKTPITSLKLQSQVAQYKVRRGLGDPQLFEKTLTVFDRQFERLNHLIDDMFDLSRINSGKFSVNLAPMDLSRLVAEIAENFAESLRAVGSELVVEAPAALTGVWDEFRLEQVLSNLLNNIIKYAPGTPVRINLRHAAGQTLLEVTDQGPGISAQAIEKLFLPFERANSDRKVSGLGLGLYISQQIMREHQGDLLVSSTVGMGTTFTLVLP